MNKKLKVHGRKYRKNDEVYLAEDFDTHPNTKKRKFDSFFSRDVFVVKEVMDDGQVLIENADKTVLKYASASRLKKINKK